jgi:subtilisin family serine protease
VTKRFEDGPVSLLARRYPGGTIIVLASLCWGQVMAEAAPAKVHPRVWADTEAGRAAPVLVLLAEQVDTAAIARQHPDRQARGWALMAALQERAGKTQAPLRALLRAHEATIPTPFWIVNAVAVQARRGLVEALAQRADVRAVESDAAVRVPLERPVAAPLAASGQTALAPTAPGGVEWGVDRIGAPALWSLGHTGQGIVYANADTGVQWDHPALQPQYRGWDGARADHNYHWWDAIHADISGNGTNEAGFSSRVPVDDYGHGTHVMGTGVGGDAANAVGVAPGARWIACRNMDEGVGRPSTYIECLQFFLAPTDLDGNNPRPDLRPDVVGNSYVCPPEELCSSTSLHLALATLRAGGVFMSAAAGNEGPGCGTVGDPPALDAAAFSVGATDINDDLAGFSSRGPVTVDGSQRPKPEVVAPGVSVRSSLPPGTWGWSSGTSMASPHVAGAVALLWSAFPHVRRNVEYTAALLEQTAARLTTSQTCGDDLPGQVPNNVFGWGRIDVLAAFHAVNRLPLAGAQSVGVQGDTPHLLQLTGLDPEAAPLIFQIRTPPAHGLLLDFHSTNGTVTYLPAHGFAGNDSFTFAVFDGQFLSSNAIVLLAVSAPADADGDGIPSAWELAHGLDPEDPADAARDEDGDGLTNREEYFANTDPRSAGSVLRIISAARRETGEHVFEWSAVGGTRYRVQYSDAHASGWFPFLDVLRPVAEEMSPVAAGMPTVMNFVDDFTRTPSPAWGIPRLYRVRVAD